MSQELPPLPRVKSDHLRLVFDRDKDLPGIAGVEPISQSAGQLITERAQLADWVEAPALPACEQLYDLNIQTSSASANGTEAKLGGAYIDLDWQTLSPRNKEIAESIGEFFIDSIDEKEKVKLHLKISPEESEEQVSYGLLGLAQEFEPQPLEWGFDTIEQVCQRYGYQRYELADGLVVQKLVDEQGFAYDQPSGRLFYSEELKQKYLASVHQGDKK